MKPSDKHNRSQLYAVDLKWCNAAYCGKMNRKIWLRVLHCKETLNLIGLLIVLCREHEIDSTGAGISCYFGYVQLHG